tara:strand:+ start:213 stop:506 length:294 start_codon:yes stop_codon:yes gene_type:complete
LKKPNKKEILASSNGWVASLLNLFPGIGAGYLYQRRWLPYFLTIGAVVIWFALGIYLQEDKEAAISDQLIGFSGLLLISAVTAIEANIAYKRSIKEI